MIEHWNAVGESDEAVEECFVLSVPTMSAITSHLMLGESLVCLRARLKVPMMLQSIPVDEEAQYVRVLGLTAPVDSLSTICCELAAFRLLFASSYSFSCTA